MEYSITPRMEAVAVRITGAITEADGNTLRKMVDEVVQTTQPRVELDLSLVPTIVSSGIGKLLALHKELKKQNRELIITGIHENLASLFSSIHLDKFFKIETAGVTG